MSAPASRSTRAFWTASTSTPPSAPPLSGSSSLVLAKASPTGACVTGACRVSATGAARSRSFTAMRAASCRCPTTSCRSACRTMSPSTGRAIHWTTIPTGSTSTARHAVSRRGGRLTRSTPSSTAPGILPGFAHPAPTSRWSRQRLIIGCRLTSTSVASSTLFYICCIPASSRAL